MARINLLVLLLTIASECVAQIPNQQVLTHSEYEDVVVENYETNLRLSVGGSMEKNITFSFDGFKFKGPISNISSYADFSITGFQIFNPFKSAREGLTAYGDADCATSYPNALLGSRNSTGPWPRLMLTSALDENSTYFRIQSFSIKAIGVVPRLTRLRMNGIAIKNGGITTFYEASATYLRTGYQKPLTMPFARLGWWPEGINALEFWAESEDGKKWKVCVDDVGVAFI